MSILMHKIVSEKLDDVEAVASVRMRVGQNERLRVQSVPEGETLTVQSHKDLTDINNIVERYQRTGYIPPGRMEPQYGDASALNKPLIELAQDAESVIVQTDDFMRTYKPADTSTTVQPNGGNGGENPQGAGAGAASPVANDVAPKA